MLGSLLGEFLGLEGICFKDKEKMAGDTVQLVEGLPSMCKSPRFNSQYHTDCIHRVMNAYNSRAGEAAEGSEVQGLYEILSQN